MFISVSDAAEKFNISKRRVQVLCEQGRIAGANMVSGVWLIPTDAPKPEDARMRKTKNADQLSLFDNFELNPNESISLNEVCDVLSISTATAKNWIRLGKLNSLDDGKKFSKDYITKLALEIKSGKDGRLKNRRNKKNVSGKTLYKDYIKCENNYAVVENILGSCDRISEDELRVILSYFALQLYNQKNGIDEPSPLFSSNHTKFSDNAVFNQLLSDLIGTINLLEVDTSNIEAVFAQHIQLVPCEDTLGFVYISLRDLSERKQTGAYYTPEQTVTTLLNGLRSSCDVEDMTYCDPCCGTGNFLIGLANNGVKVANIYGQDIDELSVLIARINMFLLDDTISIENLRSHITIGDSLEKSYNSQFSVVLGNPPWGYNYSKEETMYLLNNYRTAKSKGMESYDLFIEKGLMLLKEDGYLAYVLPEAVLSVSSHTQARELVLKQTSFRFVDYLGNAFSGVQCPAIIFGLQKDSKGHTAGCKISGNEIDYVIQTNRELDASLFAFNMKDDEYACIDAISHAPDAHFLADNAKFALGIVTGNNKEYISSSKDYGYEMVLKGSDILRYSIKETSNYIRFAPESFQQVAPTELYRAKEKLLYRFISEVPVFTYDDKQTISLNSCNILIPQIEGMEIKYILAVLNSSVAAFFISKKFNSVKLLRSHIEALPIPMISVSRQREIIEIVDSILDSPTNISEKYVEIDEAIMDIYQLTSLQRETIRNALKGKNLFLT